MLFLIIKSGFRDLEVMRNDVSYQKYGNTVRNLGYLFPKKSRKITLIFPVFNTGEIKKSLLRKKSVNGQV